MKSKHLAGIPPILLDYGTISALYLGHYPDFQVPLQDRMRLAGNLNIWEIADLIGTIIRSLKENNLIPHDMPLSYAAAFPEILLKESGGHKTPDSPHDKMGFIITWRVIRREHASLNAQPFTGKSPAKPRFRESFYIPKTIKEIQEEHAKIDQIIPIELFTDIPQENIKEAVNISSWWWDNIIRFDCFAPTQIEAEHLVHSFETSMIRFSNIVVGAGAQKFLHWNREIDDKELQEKININFKFRSVNFYVRTEEFYVDRTATISAIENEIFSS